MWHWENKSAHGCMCWEKYGNVIQINCWLGGAGRLKVVKTRYAIHPVAREQDHESCKTVRIICPPPLCLATTPAHASLLSFRGITQIFNSDSRTPWFTRIRFRSVYLHCFKKRFSLPQFSAAPGKNEHAEGPKMVSSYQQSLVLQWI